MTERIWRKDHTLEHVNARATPNIMKSVGFEVTELADDYLRGRMKVDENSHQPMGILHGGAICLLAEQLGSVAGYLCTEHVDDRALGMSLNANYFRPTFTGWVTGTARLVHRGQSTQVWDIEVVNDEGKLVAKVNFSVAIRRISAPSANVKPN